MGKRRKGKQVGDFKKTPLLSHFAISPFRHFPTQIGANYLLAEQFLHRFDNLRVIGQDELFHWWAEGNRHIRCC